MNTSAGYYQERNKQRYQGISPAKMKKILEKRSRIRANKLQKKQNRLKQLEGTSQYRSISSHKIHSRERERERVYVESGCAMYLL